MVVSSVSPGAVRDHAAVAGVTRHRDGVERFRDRADLIQLHQQGVGDPFLDAARENLGVGHEDVVADELDPVCRAPWSAFSSPSQSPSARPSSIEMIGYCRTQSS